MPSCLRFTPVVKSVTSLVICSWEECTDAGLCFAMLTCSPSSACFWFGTSPSPDRWSLAASVCSGCPNPVATSADVVAQSTDVSSASSARRPRNMSSTVCVFSKRSFSSSKSLKRESKSTSAYSTLSRLSVDPGSAGIRPLAPV